MEVSKPDFKSIYVSCLESISVKVIPIQTCPAKPENGTCTTASVHSDSIETTKFRLLSLPIEIRRMIYRYYFHNPLSDWCSKYHLVQGSKYCNIFCLKKCHTQILTVNHQIHDEATDCLYGDTFWHFSFKSFASKTGHKTVDSTFLRGFCSRPEFRFIRKVTIGVMFRTVMKESLRTLENENRLTINRKLLKKICKTLRRAPNLQTVKLLWHDKIDCGDWEKKQTCLSSLAKLQEQVRCDVFLGQESTAVHFPRNPVNTLNRGPSLSIQEELAKAKLNEYLNAVRGEYQASSRHKSSEGLEKTSTQNTIEQSFV